MPRAPVSTSAPSVRPRARSGTASSDSACPVGSSSTSTGMRLSSLLRLSSRYASSALRSTHAAQVRSSSPTSRFRNSVVQPKPASTT